MPGRAVTTRSSRDDGRGGRRFPRPPEIVLTRSPKKSGQFRVRAADRPNYGKHRCLEQRHLGVARGHPDRAAARTVPHKRLREVLATGVVTPSRHPRHLVVFRLVGEHRSGRCRAVVGQSRRQHSYTCQRPAAGRSGVTEASTLDPDETPSPILPATDQAVLDGFVELLDDAGRRGRMSEPLRSCST